MANSDSTKLPIKTLVSNRKARHNFHILDDMEAGIVLTGTEVKSARAGKVNLDAAYATLRNGELWLVGLHISEYSHGTDANHTPLRPRKLLLHSKEIRKLKRKLEEKGLALVPLEVYLKGGLIKVKIGIARGKKQYDKREDIKTRDTKREMDRVMKHYQNR